jgi:L-asparaginase type II
MIRRASGRLWLVSVATLAGALAGGVQASRQAPATPPVSQGQSPFPGTLDEHPAIRYADRPPTDRVARLNQEIVTGRQTLVPDPRTGYLLPVLKALDIPVASQLLVFSKTGLQRAHTGPQNPRALYYNGSVVVGYIPGAAALEVAALDPQQGVMFYTVEQAASEGTARFSRRTNCLTCHISAVTQEVPGFIDRSNMVGDDGYVIPALGSFAVNHQTPHTERWGGWFVTGNATAPPYGPLGHLGNLTVTPHPTSGPVILSDRVLIEWLNRPKETDTYPASESDLAALMTFDHQMPGLNLITRLNWDARIAAAESRAPASDAGVQQRVQELADYLLFTGEASMAFEVTPRPGFAEALAARAPTDRKGRSLATMDLKRRLLKYSCSYLVYSEAFTALPTDIRQAVYRRMFAILGDSSSRYAHLSIVDRLDIAEILRDTVTDLPADLLQGPAAGEARPKVTVLTTGGTIASRVGDSMQDGSALVAAVPQLAEHATVTVEEVSRVGSSQITPAHWLTMAARVNQRFREDTALKGIVITHGTDTLEDTAYFLNLTVRDRRPVVITGSMRSANEISADGPANLLNAVRVAVSDDAAGKGVLVALNEHIASARDVWKSDNRRVETFRSPELGFLGFVDPDGVVFYRAPLRAHTAASEFDVSGVAALPEVAILYDYPGFSASMIDGVLASRPAGLVFAGFAGGRLSAGGRAAVQRAVAAGVPTVIASHVPGGRIVGDPASGLSAVLARDLSPNKARVLLMLGLTRTRDAKALQRLFDAY